jgi:hypothetical protein
MCRVGFASFAYIFFGTKRNARTKTNKFNIINSLTFFFGSKRKKMRNAHIFLRLERNRIRTAHPSVEVKYDVTALTWRTAFLAAMRPRPR